MPFTLTKRPVFSPKRVITSRIDVDDHQAPNTTLILPGSITTNTLYANNLISPNTNFENLTVSQNLNSTGRSVFDFIRLPTWEPDTAYQVGEIFRRNGTFYVVLVNHTSQANPLDFYLDWFVNDRVMALGEPPGTILHSLRFNVNTPGMFAVPGDGGEYLISEMPDLYQYLNYGYSSIGGPISTVLNIGGFATFQTSSGHGLSTGQIVRINKDIADLTGTWSLGNTTLFAYTQGLPANQFQVSTVSSPDEYNVPNYSKIAYHASHFGTPGPSVKSFLWGVPSNDTTHFRVPDLRGMFLAGSGQNELISKYNQSTYNRIFGTINPDTGLDHDHRGYYEIHNGRNADTGSDTNYTYQDTRTGVNYWTDEISPVRASKTEFTPSHAAVRYYIKY